MSTTSSYRISFCVKCGQKTGWLSPVVLKMTRNRVPGLRGKCCRCKCRKSTFVSMCYYKRQMQKCKRSGSRRSR